MAEPTSVLLDALAARRRNGDTFEHAWPIAVGAALAGVEGIELDTWHAALSATSSAWQASFNRWPQRRVERALAAVADDPDREPIAGSGVACPVCGEPVAQNTRGPRKVYCGRLCQRAANGRHVGIAA